MDASEMIRSAQPEHVQDVLADVEALTASWDAPRREWLLERLAAHAARAPLPAALMLALGDLLDD